MIIMKFGGSSVANAERIRAISQIISAAHDRQPLVISSALGKTTDLLIEAGKNALKGRVTVESIIEFHHQVCHDLQIKTEPIEGLLSELRALAQGIALIKEISPKTSDYLVSFGERLAVRIIAEYLSANDLSARAYDAWDLGMLTAGDYSAARQTAQTAQLITARVAEVVSADQKLIPVVTGYISKNKAGNILTFGRGGSDLSATIYGAAIGAEEIQIWKDVDGLMTADPRRVGSALPVENISYAQASELAYFGANILHPLSMKPASAAGVPVVIKNSYNPQEKGTVITRDDKFSEGAIKSVSRKSKITLVDICAAKSLGAYGFLAEVFAVFDQYQIIVDVLASSEVSISLTIDQELPLKAISELEKIAAIKVHPDHAIVSLVYDATQTSKVLARLYTDLHHNNLMPKMISQGASKLNVSLIFTQAESDLALQTAHQTLLDLRN